MKSINKKIAFRALIIILAIGIAVAIGIIVYVTLSPVLYTDLNRYEEFKERLKDANGSPEEVEAFLPELDDLNAEKTELYVLQFALDDPTGLSINLIAAYSEEDYDTEKQKLVDNLEFSDFNCQYKGFDVSVVGDTSLISYSIYLIGSNDETRQIAWMYLYETHGTARSPICGDYALDE